ncbi:MAG: hypothetical protein C4304_03345 [candidate division GAL15 bacterium]
MPGDFRRRALAVMLYAVAMGYLEAAVVAYLRALYGIEDLLRDVPARPDPLAWVEVGREAATLLMLWAVGQAAGQNRPARWGMFLFAWGVWDLAYYLWLRLLVGFPRTLGDWDLLFLIPLPWWAPVWAPMLAAILLAAFGGSVAARAEGGLPVRVDPASAAVACAGSVMALGAVMAPALTHLAQGWQAAVAVRPAEWPWGLYLAGWAAVAWASWRVATGRNQKGGLRTGAGSASL